MAIPFTPLAPPPPSAPAPHTPGPWKAVPGTDWPDSQLEIMAETDDDYYIALLGGKNREADARLIKAAPDLLFALQYIVNTYGFDSSTHSAIWQTAHAALAKAIGESP